MSIQKIAAGLLVVASTLLVGCDDDFLMEPVGGAPNERHQQERQQPSQNQPGITSNEANYCRNAADELACLEAVEGRDQ